MLVSVLIDNDALQARLLADNLETIGHNVLWTRQAWDGLVTAYRVRPDLIIVDLEVPQSLELLNLVRATRGLSKTPLMLIAARRPSHYYLRKLAVAACIDKPFDAEELVQQIQRITHAAQRPPEPVH